MALENPKDATARLALANASLLAGASFSNSMVGIVHAMGHACGGQCSIAHGDAMGVLLPHGMAYNLDVAGDRYAELLLHLAGSGTFATTPVQDRAAAAIGAVRSLLELAAEKAGMPTRLSEVGMTAEQLPAVAALAINDGAMSFNPKDANATDVLCILEGAL